MATADNQIEYLPLFVYGTLLERPTRDSVLGPSVLRTERAAARGRWESAATVSGPRIQVCMTSFKAAGILGRTMGSPTSSSR